MTMARILLAVALATTTSGCLTYSAIKIEDRDSAWEPRDAAMWGLGNVAMGAFIVPMQRGGTRAYSLPGRFGAGILSATALDAIVALSYMAIIEISRFDFDQE
jgi:hypothetical protein